MLLAAWFHNLSPFAIRFGADFGIRWYGLAYLAGFVVAYVALRAMARRGLSLIPADRVGDAMLWLIGGTLVGGRLGYALVYDRSLFITWMDHAPWWGVLAINEGGMASHGAMVGMTLACWKVSMGFKDENGKVIGRAPWLHILDVVTLVAPAGVFFGRIANFVNGELLGKFAAPPGQEGPWWSVQYPQELDLAETNPITGLLEPGKHLQQTPEQWKQLVALARTAVPDGSTRAGLHKLAHEAWNFQPQLKPLISSRYPSQLMQAAAEGIIVGLVLWIIWARPRKPGVIIATFLVLYGILRILTEFIRLPDAHLEQERILGLSRGQWLSVGMIVIGGWLLSYVAGKPAQKMGGWLGSRTPTQSRP
jgi:phosphatidylglycerol---prolipoprotein diacylglyceryl transferase